MTVWGETDDGKPSLSKREKLKALSNQMSGLSQEALLSRKKPEVT